MKFLQLFFVIVVVFIPACASTSTTAPRATAEPPTVQPASTQSPSTFQPQSNLFNELPQRRVGETAEAAGFKITLLEARVDNGNLVINLELGNTSPYRIDLSEAVQLRDGEGRLLAPNANPTPRTLDKGAALEGQWTYSVDAQTASRTPLRLIYAPRGWSGPVFVYRIE